MATSGLSTQAINLKGAKYKLRQAEILLAHLRTVPREIALAQRRASSGLDYQLLLETYFFASLGAARSVYFILFKTGGLKFKDVESDWRNRSLDQTEKTRFNKMLYLRDRDVHFGDVSGEALATMIESDDIDSMYVQHNAAIFGPAALAEHVNPDGSTVRARGLQSSVGLHIDIGDKKYEAATACAHFIQQLRTLIAATEAAAIT